MACAISVFFIGCSKELLQREYLDENGVRVSINAISEDSLLNGDIKKYNKSGTLIVEETFVAGRLDGLRRVFYPDGKIKVEQKYEFGEIVAQNVFDRKGNWKSGFEKKGLTDSRDNKSYDIVMEDSLIWMAENLNFGGDDGACQKDSCLKLGMLYTWATIMDSVRIAQSNWVDKGIAEGGCGNGALCRPIEPVKGICPDGRHIPTSSEWTALSRGTKRSPHAMQAVGFEQWPDATDEYRLSIVPVSNRDYDGDSAYANSYAHFWTASEADENFAFIWSLETDGEELKKESKGYGNSVRCVKDR